MEPPLSLGGKKVKNSQIVAVLIHSLGLNIGMGYVLVHEEIQKYTHGSSTEKYMDRKIEVTGKVKEINPECTPYVQCRKGPYRVIYDLKSVKIIE